MAEAGGTTTQSGILYQNSWAALYLGRLLDTRSSARMNTVVSVRVEAPEAIDDIVVTHSDGTHYFIQAKENLSKSSNPWSKVWCDFSEQIDTVPEGRDRFILAIGEWTNDIGALKESCERARGKNSFNEWWDSLSIQQKNISQKVMDSLPCKDQDKVFSIVRITEVWVYPLQRLQEEEVARYIPPSSTNGLSLFRILRDMVGGKARIRGTFNQADLLDQLHSQHDISIDDSPEWGVSSYRDSIKRLNSVISVPGTQLSGTIDELFIWLPLIKRNKNENAYRDFEEEDIRYRFTYAAQIFDLKNFPRNEAKHAIIDASAGFGKTTLLTAIMHKLSSDVVRIPVMIALTEFVDSRTPVINYLHDHVNDSFNVKINWTHLCNVGRAVLMFDGLDELSDTERSWATKKIAEFSARFPLTAWLLTVRDGSALPHPLDAERFDIQRLDDSLVIALTKSYQKGGARLQAERLQNHMRHHPDLAHLLRIPLFLALVLAITKPEDDLPSNRSDLLETYLSLLFSPERHKDMGHASELLDDLREGAEYLAFQGLENGSIGLVEQSAKSLLRNAELSESSGLYIERLIRYGVLRRYRSRLYFTYPIIQEYLAACWMVREQKELVAARFRNVVNRPWAQAIQFSLEMHPEAEEIIRTQLATKDDIFHTVLRLIGRCIVNGAKVSSELKTVVGDRLAEAWLCEDSRTRDKIGILISDGFTSNLPKQVEKLLFSGLMLSDGGAEIVTKIDDESFTEKVLKGFLSKNLEHKVWLHGWQCAVDKIEVAALERYIERAIKQGTTENEIASLSSLILRLPNHKLPKNTLKKLSDDVTLPALIRLACSRHLKVPMSRSNMHLIKSFFKKGIDFWLKSSAEDYFWYVEGAIDEFVRFVEDMSQDKELIESLLTKLLRSKINITTQRKYLHSAINVASKERKMMLMFGLALTGDSDASNETINNLIEMPDDLARQWGWHINKFNNEDALKGLAQLKKRKPLAERPIHFIINMNIGLLYETDMSFHCATALDKPNRHPSYSIFLKWFDEILTAKHSSLEENISAYSLKKELGYLLDNNEAIILLKDAWSYCLSRANTGCDEYDRYHDENNLSVCIRFLDSSMHESVYEILREIAITAGFNASSDALTALSDMGDERDLYWMVENYKKLNKESYSDVYYSLEKLAVRCGKCVTQNGEELIVSDW